LVGSKKQSAVVRGYPVAGFAPLVRPRLSAFVAANARLPMDQSFQLNERITGYELIDCANMEEAIELAAAHPMASLGTIEIRQLWHVD
jgi:hypothetical protein